MHASTCCSQFVLGSHEFDTPPPTEMNNTPTVAGEGVFADVVQVPFPAGSGILYDSRTYVRLQPSSWRLELLVQMSKWKLVRLRSTVRRRS